MKHFQEKYPFKDLKTKTRMQNYVPEPEFELSNKDDIDNKFEEFCQKFRQREADDFYDLPKGSRNEGPDKPFVRRDLKKLSTKLIVAETMNELRYSIEDSRRFLKSSGTREHHESLDYDSAEVGLSMEKQVSTHLKKMVTKEGNYMGTSQFLDEK